MKLNVLRFLIDEIPEGIKVYSIAIVAAFIFVFFCRGAIMGNFFY